MKLDKLPIIDWEGIENAILYRLVGWIVKRRGVEFIYWVSPETWEEYMIEDE